jgi:shikimate dehydrogenase
VVKANKLIGYNTDASGALQALQDGGGSLTGKHVLLLGSGGAARAIAFSLASLSDLGGLTILGIDEQERSQLVQDLHARTGRSVEQGPVDDEHLGSQISKAQVLIHCTPIGMSPKINATVVPSQLLHRNLTVMDIVYNPLDTRLLKEAKQVGCRVIRGVEMFLAQAVGQFELWTGNPAPKEVMRKVLESKFS